MIGIRTCDVERTILEDLEKHPAGLDKLEVKKIFYQLLKSLQLIHSLNIIHRDIKPENILLTKNACLKLCETLDERGVGDDVGAMRG